MEAPSTVPPSEAPPVIAPVSVMPPETPSAAAAPAVPFPDGSAVVSSTGSAACPPFEEPAVSSSSPM